MSDLAAPPAPTPYAARTTVAVRGPIVAKGFDFGGRTDRNPDLCACGDPTPWCSRCAQDIEDGQLIVTTVRETRYDGYPDEYDLDQDLRHYRCPRTPR